MEILRIGNNILTFCQGMKRGISESVNIFRSHICYCVANDAWLLGKKKNQDRNIGSMCYATFSVYLTIQLQQLNRSLFLLLAHRERYWLAPQPQSNKGQPSSDGNRDTCHPWPGTTDDPTPWPLVVRKVSDGNRVLLLHV